MNRLYIEYAIKYTGSELCPHWIYRNFGLMGDSIVAFSGEADVKITEMADIEDILKNEPIYSKNMLHFIIEHFEISLTEAVLRQRMLINIIKETFEAHGKSASRKGDDLFFEGKKLSVSIAAKSLTSCLIHTGVNICADGAPIEVSSLEDMGVSDIRELANSIMEAYDDEMQDVKLAVTKVRGV